MAACLSRKLCAPRHLDREAAFEQLRISLVDPASVQRAEEAIQLLLHEGESVDAWCARAAGLRVASALAEAEADEAKAEKRAEELSKRIVDHLSDSEPRVRHAAVEASKVVGQRGREQAWNLVHKAALRSVRDNFVREENTDQKLEITLGGDDADDDQEDWLLGLLLRANQAPKPGTGTLRPSTEGWRCLETSLRILQALAEGRSIRLKKEEELGNNSSIQAASSLADEETVSLLAKAMLHENRFVREAAHRVVESICQGSSEEDVHRLGDAFAPFLARGLGDNWSQVRYAASAATRAFLVRLGESRVLYYELLVPRMALNRHYVAEGVRNYSQETWEQVMGSQGKEWMAKVFPHVAKYYIQQCKADNHAVREASCACIAEAMIKVERKAVAPYVAILLKALLACFKDESWPVRDAACTATARATVEFAEETRPVLDELYQLWFDHLWDNIASVRENSAFALAQVRKAYGEEAEVRILPVLKERLKMARVQQEDSKRFSGLQNTSTFGVAHARRLVEKDSDDSLRENQTMFSCGSLAPKLRRGGGCMDHGFQREKEPWEASDGAIYLLAELSFVIPETVLEFMDELSELAYVRHFSHYYNLQETLWRKLPVIAENVGKHKFRTFVDLFIGPLFDALECGHQLSECAAGKCIIYFQKSLGESIFHARLDERQKYLLYASQFTSSTLR